MATRRDDEARPAAEARQAAEEARIEELVNERVAAQMEQVMEETLAKKMAEMEVRHRAEQQQRGGNMGEEAAHQQDPGRPTPNPSEDELADASATAMAGRLQTSGDIGAVPHPATLRMTN